MAYIYIFTFHLVLFIFLQPNSALETLILPLKTQLMPSPNNISFHRNVSLTVSLTVGTPPQKVVMVLDTGSELSWLRCNNPSFPNSLPTFNPRHSSSYTPMLCSSPACSYQVRGFSVPVWCDPNKLCHTTVSYADSSFSEGNLAYETFYIGSSSIPGTIFGCMSTSFSSSSEEDPKSTGLMGMNRGSLSFVSQMGFPKFSYCISEGDSSGVLLLGNTSSPWVKPLSYTPLLQISSPLPYFDRAAYTVQLEGIMVSKKVLTLPKYALVPDHTGAGQTMIDSGTQFTFLLGPVYDALRNEFISQTRGILQVLDDTDFIFQGAMDLCYRVPPTRTGFSDLPTVSLMFSGAEIVVTSDQLLYQVAGEMRGSDSVYCFTFGNSELLGIEAFVIGHHHQQNVWVEFDLQNSRIGFAPIQCDVASLRLGV
ncbi:hypothetical protein MKW94_013032 [Papaver nudicaule]|uniref:Peptidase A1 domain-containing protein n=1 Tax=Papaver nudicaule TaxID=74823 RepID=A0AA41VEZ7_PAPNU|nr:hypothetical protein [Papaver nudicaule]